MPDTAFRSDNLLLRERLILSVRARTILRQIDGIVNYR